MVTAHIIIIGDELADGHIQDINILPITRTLKEHGIYSAQVSIVRDQEDSLKSILKSAWDQHDLVITTGGLGPTQDDITKKMIGELAEGTLQISDKAQALVESHYQRINRPWNKETNSYHMIPEGIEALLNPVGLAPGLCYQNDKKLLLAAPGVPRELVAMLNEVFIPIITKTFAGKLTPLKSFCVRTYGIPEEKIFFDLEPDLWEQLKKYGKVSSLPQSSGVDINVAMSTHDFDLYKDELTTLFQQTSFAANIWQFGTMTLPEYILQQARAKKLTISCAESCTGGLVSSMFTDIAGCSDVFLGGAVTYSNEAKIDLLNVAPETIEQFGAVSEEVVRQMSAGASKHFQSDLSVSFSGIAGPSGGSTDKPVGMVAMAVTYQSTTQSFIYHMHGNRLQLKQRFAMRGLAHLLKIIEHGHA
jgi:nicotinamide-nucleotide amidase